MDVVAVVDLAIELMDVLHDRVDPLRLVLDFHHVGVIGTIPPPLCRSASDCAKATDRCCHEPGERGDQGRCPAE
jgi:hypothetical protein